MAVGPTDPQLVLKVTPPRIPRTVLERPRLSSVRPEFTGKSVIALQAWTTVRSRELPNGWRKSRTWLSRRSCSSTTCMRCPSRPSTRRSRTCC